MKTAGFRPLANYLLLRAGACSYATGISRSNDGNTLATHITQNLKDTDRRTPTAISDKPRQHRSLMRKFVDFYIRKSGRIWDSLPPGIKSFSAGRRYGRHLHSMVCRYSRRGQNHSTFFLRNRPEMELMCSLAAEKGRGSTITISVLGCSKGAEVYSIMWSLRKVLPDMTVALQAVDISREIVDFAKNGIYSSRNTGCLEIPPASSMTTEERVAWLTCRDQGIDTRASIFERLDRVEMEGMLDSKGDQAVIKPWLRTGIAWHVGDVSTPELVRKLGQQDIVVANRFLCHMQPAAAESCLRNIATLVKPGGYLFVSGVDLDVRTKVAREMNWSPVLDQIREVYEGDPSLVPGWPLAWWGLEPFDERRPDWRIRYAAVFQVGKPSAEPLSFKK
jgi:chemotaxis methyl-accepting protein methylase